MPEGVPPMPALGVDASVPYPFGMVVGFLGLTVGALFDQAGAQPPLTGSRSDG